MINITTAAAEQIREAAADTGADDMALRVAARVDALTGELQYGMGFDEEREHDEECIASGVRVLVSSHSREQLEGVTIDFVEISPGECNFIFIPAPDRGEPETGGCSSSGTCRTKGCGGGSCN